MNEEIRRVRATAECLYDTAAIELAVDQMAAGIARDLGREDPLLLSVMTGGVTITGMLLQRLDFPLQLDYIHLSRYGSKTVGGQIRWLRTPSVDLADRTVLIVDDLLDHGRTLEAVVQHCRDGGARRVSTAVLVVKQLAQRDGLQTVDYHALETADRYLFGYGMDYKSYWRNAPGIFAVTDA